MPRTINLGNLLIHLNLDISKYLTGMATVEAKMKIASKQMAAIGSRMSLLVTAPIVAMGTLATKSFASFDDAMTKSLSIMSGITPQIRQQMTDLAITMSTEGVTSAKDLARSYFFLASAGLDAQQSMAALGQVEKFAVAGAFDMATATDLVTDAQSALGLTVKDAQANLVNMTRVTDVLTGANTLANASTEQFSLALTSQAGPAMKAYGIELEEGVAVLAAFADQGIKAQNAGNLFSRMLRLMTKGFLANRGAWRQLGINIFEANGDLKAMSVIVGDLSNALGDMAPKQKIAALDMLGFKARSQQAILPLLGMQDAIAGYNDKLKDMKGITKEVAERQLKSFSSQMKIVKNNITAMGIEIGKILAPKLKELGEKIKNVTTAFREMDEASKTMIIRLALIAAAIGPILIGLSLLIKALITLKVVTLALIANPALPALALLIGIIAVNMIDAAAQSAKWSASIAEGERVAEESTVAWQRFREQILLVNEEMDTSKAKRFVSEYDAAKEKVLALTDEMKRLQATLATAKGFKGNIKNVLFGDVEPFKIKQRLKEINDELEIETKWMEKLGSIKDKEAARLQKDIDARSPILDDKGVDGDDKSGKRALAPFFDDDTFTDIMDKWIQQSLDLSTNIAGAMTSGLEQLSAGITDLIFTGEADFASMMDSIAKQVVQTLIQSAIASAVSGIGGMGGGKEETNAQEQVIAAQNQATAVQNTQTSLTNAQAALVFQGSGIAHEAAAIGNELAGVSMEFASFGNEAAGTEMITASVAMGFAASEMMAAAMINAGASGAAGVKHRGGMIGNGGPTRSVPVGTFNGAPRFHNGLADKEFATILEEGEVVLEKNNVAELKRSSRKGGGGGGDTIINNYNIKAWDSKSVNQMLKTHRKSMMSANQKSRSENNKARRSNI